MIRKFLETLKFKDYDLFQEDINQRNMDTLGKMGATGVLIAIASALLELLIKPNEVPGEAICFLLFSLVMIYFYYQEKKTLKNATVALYAFVILALVGAGSLGTFLDLDTHAFTFMVLMLALPQFILDKPTRVSAMIAVLGIGFAAAAYYYKPADIFITDMTHLVVVIPLAIGINFFCLTNMIENVRHGTDMERQSEHDALTRVYNRNGGINRIERCMTNLRGGTFFFMDIDHFKHINDAFGHEQGDEVLKAFAKMLQESFRATDIVMRFGGDEFAVYSPDMVDADFVEQKLKELLASARLIPQNQEETEFCTISVGCIINDGWYPDFRTIMASADKLLYKSKNEGRDRYHYSSRSFKGSEMEAEHLRELRFREEKQKEEAKKKDKAGEGTKAEGKPL